MIIDLYILIFMTQVSWSSLPAGYHTQLLTALENVLPSLNNRELSNVFWALGKLDVDYTNDLSVSFREVLIVSLVDAASALKLFDLESIFVGLGLMQVSIRSRK